MFHLVPPPAGPTVTQQVHRALAEKIVEGRTIYGLGKDAGVDPAVISRWINGKTEPSARTLDRLAWSLGFRLTRADGSAVPSPEEAMA